MPLNLTSLQSDLEALFSDPPSTVAACAQLWGDAVESYAAAIVPASTAVSAAKAPLVTALLAAFTAAPPDPPTEPPTPSAAPGFDAAFMAFAATVATGMLPAFAGVVPAGPLNIASLMTSTRPTHAAAATAFASHIDLWFKSGTASLVAPPGPTINWT